MGSSEELVIGATTRMPNAGESGGATSSVSSSMSAAYDTDSHGAYSERLETPSSKRGLVLGLVGTLVVGALVLAGIWGASGDDEPSVSTAAADGERPEESPTPDQPRVIVPKTPPPQQPPAPSDTPPPEPTDPEPTDPEPTELDPDLDPDLELDPELEAEPDPDPEPTDPEPATTPKRKPSASEPAPLTDKKVRWRLARKLKKKCKSSADGPVTLDLIVGSNGSVLSKNMHGVSSGLKSCLTEGLAGVKFPEGKTRTVKMKVDF
jgi:hypothetical protein